MRYSARRINRSDRPWAVIDSQGPFGDVIVAGWITEGDRAQRLADAFERRCYERGVCIIGRSLKPDMLALFRADRPGQ